jgi:GNAT superfamily N-acetyltransferase
MPQIAQSDSEITRCYAVMAELRPHVTESEFVARVREMQAQAYQLAFIEHDGVVVAVAGYRITTNLHMGRHLYVEDLVVRSDARSQGHGARFIDWLRERARSADCRYLDLDSGTQRRLAHRFYFANGFTIASYHFSEQLAER